MYSNTPPRGADHDLLMKRYETFRIFTMQKLSPKGDGVNFSFEWDQPGHIPI